MKLIINNIEVKLKFRNSGIKFVSIITDPLCSSCEHLQSSGECVINDGLRYGTVEYKKFIMRISLCKSHYSIIRLG